MRYSRILLWLLFVGLYSCSPEKSIYHKGVMIEDVAKSAILTAGGGNIRFDAGTLMNTGLARKLKKLKYKTVEMRFNSRNSSLCDNGLCDSVVIFSRVGILLNLRMIWYDFSCCNGNVKNIETNNYRFTKISDRIYYSCQSMLGM